MRARRLIPQCFGVLLLCSAAYVAAQGIDQSILPDIYRTPWDPGIPGGIPADDVVSPTFVLCQSYRGRRTLHHFDAYRIKDDDEFLELGVDEYFDSDGVTFVEWADRVASLLPADRIEITIEVTGPTSRHIAVAGTSASTDAMVTQIQAACGLA